MKTLAWANTISANDVTAASATWLRFPVSKGVNVDVVRICECRQYSLYARLSTQLTIQ